MGYFLSLGQDSGNGNGAPAGRITVSPTGLIEWQSNVEYVEVFVSDDGGATWKAVTRAAGNGREQVRWVVPGGVYDFTLVFTDADADTITLSTFHLDLRGPSPTSGGTDQLPPPGGAPPSWFEDSTLIFGAAIPNMYLAAGGGLLLLGMIAKRSK